MTIIVRWSLPSPRIILPGPSDLWGGTSGTSGWRSHTLNILFGVDKLSRKGEWNLVIDLVDNHREDSPVFKVTVNGKPWKFKLTKGSGNDIAKAMLADSAEWKTPLQRVKHHPKSFAIPAHEWTLCTASGYKTIPKGVGHRNIIFSSTNEAEKFIRNKREIFSESSAYLL